MSAGLCYRLYRGNGQRGSTYNDLAESDPDRFVRYSSLGGENPNDSFGSRNGNWSGTGVYTDPPLVTLPGKAFSCNNSRVINLPNPNSSLITKATLTCWVKRSGPQNNRAGFIGYRGKLYSGINSGAQINHIYNFNDLPSQYLDALGQQFQDNTWHFTTLTIDTQVYDIDAALSPGIQRNSKQLTSTLNLFDRVAKKNQDLTPIIINTGGAIGDDFGLNDSRFNGEIYDARIYTRLLSDQDFLEIYGGPEPKKAISPVSPVFSVAGNNFTCTTGAWDAQGNGSLQYSYLLQKKLDGIWTDYKKSFSPTFPKETGEFRYFVRAINNGGGSLETYQSNSLIVNQINWIPQAPSTMAAVQAGIIIGNTNTSDIASMLDLNFSNDAQYLSYNNGNVVLTHSSPKHAYRFKDFFGTVYTFVVTDAPSSYQHLFGAALFGESDSGPVIATSLRSFQKVDVEINYFFEKQKLTNRFKRTS
jgi:hypothetical protein